MRGPVTMADGKIDILARKVDVMWRCSDPKIDLGVGHAKPGQPVDKPLRSKIRRCAHRKGSAALPLQHPLGTVGDAVERIAHDHQIGATCLGDRQPLSLAIKKLQSEFGFECLDLVAYGALGDAKLLGGPRETFVARRSLKGLERIQRWQPPRHWQPIS